MLVKRVTSIVLLLCLLAGGSAFGRELRVAVMPFESGGYLDISYVRRDELLEGITQMVTDRLAQEPDLVLIERDRVRNILEEQKFQMSGFVDASTAVEMGRLLGVDVMVLGSLNEFGMNTSGGVSVGPFTVKGSRANVRISGRLISVQTGEILTSIQSEGEKLGAALEVDSFKGISFNSASFRNSTLGQALAIAVDDFAGKFTKALDHLEITLADKNVAAVSGEIVAMKGSYVIVNIGADRGVNKGDILYVVREELFPGLDQPVRIPVGKLQVLSSDPHASVTTIQSTEGGMAIQIGDNVTLGSN